MLFLAHDDFFHDIQDLVCVWNLPHTLQSALLILHLRRMIRVLRSTNPCVRIWTRPYSRISLAGGWCVTRVTRPIYCFSVVRWLSSSEDVIQWLLIRDTSKGATMSEPKLTKFALGMMFNMNASSKGSVSSSLMFKEIICARWRKPEPYFCLIFLLLTC